MRDWRTCRVARRTWNIRLQPYRGVWAYFYLTRVRFSGIPSWRCKDDIATRKPNILPGDLIMTTRFEIRFLIGEVNNRASTIFRAERVSFFLPVRLWTPRRCRVKTISNNLYCRCLVCNLCVLICGAVKLSVIRHEKPAEWHQDAVLQQLYDVPTCASSLLTITSTRAY